ncbi:MAG: three-Cys-motif partner protein TcmP [Megasphaera sp.]|jgi:hypothetical protein|nr:three-Cys-motif partner protein TcmP [Megasphaera sp.]
MVKRNNDFFKVKKTWSEVKDELLGCYLKPYIQKILYTQRPIIYIDCFAGKGKFEDGNPGSPLIALNTMQGCLGQTKMNDWSIKPFFIDLNYADDLRANLAEYGEVCIIPGRYENEIEKLLADKSGCNVFLYIDPYGIKNLDYGLFQSFSTQYRFNSIELLINMNSFGFIREGCRVLGVPFEDASIFEDLIEYESTKLEANEKSVNVLNDIAGGDYWQAIIKAKNRNELSIYEAEAQFAEQYCNRMRQNYKYVLNMPLKIKCGQLPKYRMIHATNHVEGCLLMVDNICGRWQLMKYIQDGGQMQLWEENYNNDMVNKEDIHKKIIKYVSGYVSFCRLNAVLADFFMKYGPICKASVVKSVLKNLEGQGLLEVKRNPAYTNKGKRSSFFSDDRKQKTEIRWHS